MKPAAFQYERPGSTREAVSLLGRLGDEAKVLAGGQSLVPLLNFRLAGPEVLIDLNGIDELTGIRRTSEGLEIGAMTRQATVENSVVVSEHWPLLTEALKFVAHPQIRNRGTIGGSSMHADPSAELPVAMTALDAVFDLESVDGSRSLSWEDLFVTHLTTSIEPEELLVRIRIPAHSPTMGWSFQEFSRRHGDFAMAGAAVGIDLDGEVCTEVRIALLGAGETPVRARAAERLLTGSALKGDWLEEAAEAAVEGAEPVSDMHGDAEYRKNLLKTMVSRGLKEASARSETKRK